MGYVWGLISLVIFFALLYLGVQAVISVAWSIGFGLVSLVIFLLVFKVINDYLGWGFIVTILIVLVILELVVW